MSTPLHAIDLRGLPPVGSMLDGRLRLDAVLGAGGMAVVYAATQVLAQREVAVKMLFPLVARSDEVVERFLREARAAARIDHRGVVMVHDVGQYERSFYLVMERLSGESLRDRLARGPLPLHDAIDVFLGVAGAVHAAHARGVVHRDLKPENVFLVGGEPTRPKVLDFGISKLSETESLTLTGAIVGTPYYLAPEQAEGAPDVGPQVDVWQLGVLLYEMLSGRTPYEGDTCAALLIAILSSPPRSLRTELAHLPEPVHRTLDRALARDRAHRARSVVQLVAELGPLLASHTLDEALRAQLAAPRTRMQTAHDEPLPPPLPSVPPSPLTATEPIPPRPLVATTLPIGSSRTRRAIALAVGLSCLASAMVAALTVGAVLTWSRASSASPVVAAPPPVAPPVPVPPTPTAPIATPVASADPTLPLGVEPPPPARVRVTCTPRATVRRGDELVGTTPLDVLVDSPITLRLFAPEHRERRIELDPASATSVDITLEPLPRAPDEPRPVSTAEPRAAGHASEPRPVGTRSEPHAGRLSAEDF